MIDKELLVLAAKAGGMTGMWFASTAPDSPMFFNRPNYLSVYGVWNPLTDDGDALRLAVKLGIDISKAQVDFYDKHSGDPYAATRRAIVRAAAEIGKTVAEKSA